MKRKSINLVCTVLALLLSAASAEAERPRAVMAAGLEETPTSSTCTIVGSDILVRSFPENSKPQTPVGGFIHVPILGPNPLSSYLRYDHGDSRLLGPDKDSFYISGIIGGIHVWPGTLEETYDYETKNEYQVSVRIEHKRLGITDDPYLWVQPAREGDDPSHRRGRAPIGTISAHCVLGRHQPVGKLDGAVEHRSRHQRLRPAVPRGYQRELDHRPPERERHQRDDHGPNREHS